MITKFYSNYILNKVKSGPNKFKYPFNLNNSDSIAVLFDATQVDDIQLVKKFVYSFSKGKEKVSAIGYVNKKKKSMDHISILHFDFFTNQNVNWYGKPCGFIVNNFLDYKYDILIDLSLKSYYSLNYLIIASNAKFKIGKSKKDITIFDHEIKSDKDYTLIKLIKKINDYLT